MPVLKLNRQKSKSCRFTSHQNSSQVFFITLEMFSSLDSVRNIYIKPSLKRNNYA